MPLFFLHQPCTATDKVRWLFITRWSTSTDLTLEDSAAPVGLRLGVVLELRAIMAQFVQTVNGVWVRKRFRPTIYNTRQTNSDRDQSAETKWGSDSPMQAYRRRNLSAPRSTVGQSARISNRTPCRNPYQPGLHKFAINYQLFGFFVFRKPIRRCA